MRVKVERVSKLNACKEGPEFRADQRRPGICGIHVEPQIILRRVAHVSQLRNTVKRARGCGAACPDSKDRDEALGFVSGDGSCEWAV